MSIKMHFNTKVREYAHLETLKNWFMVIWIISENGDKFAESIMLWKFKQTISELVSNNLYPFASQLYGSGKISNSVISSG